MTSGKDLHFGIQDLNKAFPLDSPWSAALCSVHVLLFLQKGSLQMMCLYLVYISYLRF